MTRLKIMSAPDEQARTPVCRFGPDRRLATLSALGAALLIAYAALSTDAAGRLITSLAAAVCVTYTVTDLAFWPRLTATADGLRIHTPLARARLSWAQIDAIRVDERTRFGLMTRTLEVDAGALLVVFGRRELGQDPRTVAGLLSAFDPYRRQ